MANITLDRLDPKTHCHAANLNPSPVPGSPWPAATPSWCAPTWLKESRLTPLSRRKRLTSCTSWVSPRATRTATLPLVSCGRGGRGPVGCWAGDEQPPRSHSLQGRSGWRGPPDALPDPTDWLAVAFTSTQPAGASVEGWLGRARAQATQHDALSLPLAPSRSGHGQVHQKGRSLTWSNTWLLVALYFCAMASATAFGPMNSVFQL